jgi:predicted DNA-binding transcriptional regulator AlpA
MQLDTSVLSNVSAAHFQWSHDDFISSEEAGLFLGLSPRTLERFRLEGRGPAYFKFGRIVRYRRAETLKWAEAQLRTSTSDPGLAVA